MEEPNLVWHYTDGAGLQGIITGHQLWAGNSAFMNDRRELEQALDIMRELDLSEYLEAGTFADTQIRVVWPRPARSPLRNSIEILDSTTYLLSGSLRGDSLSMWRGYAGLDQVSYAVGLDPDQPLGILDPQQPGTEDALVGPDPRVDRWANVIYDQDQARTFILKVLEDLRDECARSRNSKGFIGNTMELLLLGGRLNRLISQASVRIKHHGFVDEGEVRISLAARDHLRRYRPGRHGVTPYVALTGASAWGEVVKEPGLLPIKEIRLSPGADPHYATAGVRDWLQSAGYQAIEVNKLEFDDTEIKMYVKGRELIRVSVSEIPFR